MPRYHTKKWKENEIKKFYKLLEIFGIDFDSISNDNFFPNRSRQQIMKRYNKECKLHPEWIDHALNRKGKRNRYMNKFFSEDGDFMLDLNTKKPNTAAFLLNSSDEDTKCPKSPPSPTKMLKLSKEDSFKSNASL